MLVRSGRARCCVGAVIVLAMAGCNSQSTVKHDSRQQSGVRREIKELIHQLDTRDVAIRIDAVSKLVAHGEAARPQLIEALTCFDKDVRCGASEALLLIDPNAESVILETVSKSPADIRATAAIGMMRANTGLPAAIKILRQTLHDPDPTVHHASMKAFSELTAKSTAAVPSLLEMLQGNDAKEQQAAVFALVRVGPGATEALPVLCQALQQGSPAVREGAAQAIGAIGKVDESVIPILESAKDDADPNVRFRALQALRQIRSS